MTLSWQTILEKLSELKEESNHLLADFLDLYLDFYLPRGEIEPEKFILSLYLAVYDTAYGYCNNVLSEDDVPRYISISKANSKPIIVEEGFSTYEIKSIPRTLFSTIFNTVYDIDEDFSSRCFAIINKGRNNVITICH